MARRGPAKRMAGKTGARDEQAQNGFVRAQVAGVQRARILGAMVDVACERGAASVTVAHVVERSGVSRRTFYETFNDREECFLAAFEQALARAAERVLPAYESAKGWRERMRAGLVAFLAFLDEQPRLGRVLVSESLAGGSEVRARRAEVVARVTAIVDEGRGESRGAGELPSLTGEGVVGGALTVIQSRLLGSPAVVAELGAGEARSGSLVELASPLMSSIVLPYLGPGAARRELRRSVVVPALTGAPGHLAEDPFKEAGMRLTYRTVRVLLAVADEPGASNRVIGEAAGMTDQGQISKLLGRLKRLGLVSTTGLGVGTGAPNAWTLTDRGRRMTDAVRAHASEGLK